MATDFKSFIQKHAQQRRPWLFRSAIVCGICGRPLTDPESVAKGIGPVCEKHMGPGPHPSGSPQSVHAGGSSRIAEEAARNEYSARVPKQAYDIRAWSHRDVESYGANLTHRSDYGAYRKSDYLPADKFGDVFRGSSDPEQPVKAIYGKRRKQAVGRENREGIFGTTNEAEAGFYGALGSILNGAEPIDKENPKGEWDLRGEKPAVYKLKNPKEIRYWEYWTNQMSEKMREAMKVPFEGQYDEIILKDIRTPRFERVRDVTKKELVRAWSYINERRPDLMEARRLRG